MHGHESCGSHGVACIEQLSLPSKLQHPLYHGREVIVSHLIPGEVPEPISLIIWVQEGMVPAVGVTPVVTKPDIIPSICQDKPCTILVISHDIE